MADVRVVDYAPRWRDDFARLNFEWIERWFTVEKTDEDILGDPETHVLKSGGLILMAVDNDDHAVGTVAIKHHGDGRYELTKMAVEPGHRGEGIGRVLIEAALDRYGRLEGNRPVPRIALEAPNCAAALRDLGLPAPARTAIAVRTRRRLHGVGTRVLAKARYPGHAEAVTRTVSEIEKRYL